MIISRTPFRISFFGGGTDYPDWYRKNGGVVLATTINKYCYLTVRYLPPFFDNKYRLVYNIVERCQKINQIQHPAVKGIIKFLKIKEGLEIHHDGDLPARSGLGSSSAFTVGLLHALYALQGYMPNKQKLAKESIHIEQNILKETVGSQDQVLTAYGGFNLVTFQKDGDMTITPITLPSKRISELENHLMLFYTGISRISSNITKTYANNINDQKKQLEEIKKLVDQALLILDSKKDINLFGKLLHQAWETKRSFSSAVSNPFIDKLYNQALSSGATGGKIIGAGGGGFLLLFAPPSLQKKVRKKLHKSVYVPFRFEHLGSQIIFFDKEEEYYNKRGLNYI